MEKHPRLLDERIYYEHQKLGDDAKPRKLRFDYFRILVGDELAHQAMEKANVASIWKGKLMPFTDDPMMTDAQRQLWDKMKPDWQAAIEQSRKPKPVRKKFKAAYDNMVVHLMGIDALSDEEKRLFLDDDLEGRLIKDVGWHPRLVVQTFKQAVMEPPWIREAPIFQQREALMTALTQRMKSRSAANPEPDA